MCRLQESIAAAAGVKASMVRVVLSAGSVIATVTLPLEAAHQARVSELGGCRERSAPHGHD